MVEPVRARGRGRPGGRAAADELPSPGPPEASPVRPGDDASDLPGPDDAWPADIAPATPANTAPAETAPADTALADEAWRLMAGFFFQIGMRHMAESHRHTGLNPGAIKALQSLDPDAPRPMGSLADAWGCDASNVTWLVDRLEERGLVERHASLTDRRVKTVVLTETGIALRRDIDAIWSVAPPPVHALDPDDLAVLIAILRKLRPA